MMTKQPSTLGIQRQNKKTRAAIEQVARWFAQTPVPLPWLAELLGERGLSLANGILVRYDEIFEQERNLCKGIWLNSLRHFWQFEVLVPRQSSASISVEHFRDISKSMNVAEHTPGVGRSFGWLALQVLEKAPIV